MKTVLLVEDSKILQMVSQRSLTKAGYQVLLAEDGEKALSIAQSNLLDVIVLDMMLPKLSGPQVLGRLQQDPFALTQDKPAAKAAAQRAAASQRETVAKPLTEKERKRREEKLRKEGAMAFIEKNQSAENPNLLVLTIEQVLKQESTRDLTFDGIPVDVIGPSVALHQ